MEIQSLAIAIIVFITFLMRIPLANVTTIHLKALFMTGKKALTNLDFQM